MQHELSDVGETVGVVDVVHEDEKRGLTPFWEQEVRLGNRRCIYGTGCAPSSKAIADSPEGVDRKGVRFGSDSFLIPATLTPILRPSRAWITYFGPSRSRYARMG